MTLKPTLRITLTTILLSLLLLTMGSFGYSFYRNARATAVEFSDQVLDQTSSLIDVQINDLLHSANEQGKTNLRLIKSGRFGTSDVPELARYWLEIMEVHPRLTRMSLGVEATGEWFYVHRLGGKLAVGELRRDPSTGNLGLTESWAGEYPNHSFLAEPDKPGFDPRPRPWYLAAKETGRQTWSETFALLGTNNQAAVPGITCATPILKKDGSLFGVLGASFDVIDLSTYLRSLRVGKRGYAFVVEFRKDGTRRVIAHKDPKILVRPVARKKSLKSDDQQVDLELVPPDELADLRVPAFLKRIPEGLVPSDLRGTTKLEFQQGGVSYLGAYSCLSSRETPDWLICIVMPENDVMAQVYAGNRSTFLIGVGLVLAASLVSLYVSSQVARPLEWIARETEAIGRIELQPKPVAHSIVSEVDRLAEAVEKTKTSLRSFRKFVPVDLIRLVQTTGREATLGGETRRMTVSFCDLANFTNLSETVSPEELVRHLGDYFGTLSGDILATGGTVDKYIGDAIMAFWGAPAPSTHHAISACEAALRNLASLEELRRRWRLEGKPELFARIGIHTGKVIVGNIGSEARLNYTVMGDTVNLASRLEGLGKTYGTRILISESTYQDTKDLVIARAVDRVSVKGKTESMIVYELLSLKADCHDNLEELAGLSQRAFELFLNRDFEFALKIFDEIGRLRPGDGPSRVLADRCERFLESPPSQDWDGVYRMTNK